MVLPGKETRAYNISNKCPYSNFARRDVGVSATGRSITTARVCAQCGGDIRRLCLNRLVARSRGRLITPPPHIPIPRPAPVNLQPCVAVIPSPSRSQCEPSAVQCPPVDLAGASHTPLRRRAVGSDGGSAAASRLMQCSLRLGARARIVGREAAACWWTLLRCESDCGRVYVCAGAVSVR